MVNAGLSWSFGAGNANRSSFYSMPCDYGLDLNQLDLGKDFVQVDTIEPDGKISSKFISQDKYDTGVEDDTITVNSDEGSAGSGGTNPTGYD